MPLNNTLELYASSCWRKTLRISACRLASRRQRHGYGYGGWAGANAASHRSSPLPPACRYRRRTTSARRTPRCSIAAQGSLCAPAASAIIAGTYPRNRANAAQLRAPTAGTTAVPPAAAACACIQDLQRRPARRTVPNLVISAICGRCLGRRATPRCGAFFAAQHRPVPRLAHRQEATGACRRRPILKCRLLLTLQLADAVTSHVLFVSSLLRWRRNRDLDPGPARR